MTAAGSESIEVIRRIQIKPDPGVLRAIGLNHDFESAIADLVDNSIDAGANRILIRFLLRRDGITGVQIIDDGQGMGSHEIDIAMKLGRPKTDSHLKLGHFGMGLKSASFSQAAVLTVLSHRAATLAEGRRMMRESAGTDFEVDVLSPTAVGARFTAIRHVLGDGETGTLVEWSDCRGFPASSDPTVTTAFLETRVAALRNRLGLIFHRLLENAKISVAIDVWDLDSQAAGLQFAVGPINPFGYTRPGEPGYPHSLRANFRGRALVLGCHIWPANSDSPQYRLFGSPVESFQGFYLYRNNRLLTTGGWHGVIQENKSLRLARVQVDIEHHLDGFAMSSEKTGVHLVADLVRAIERASDDEVTFTEYLSDAMEAFKAGNRRIRKRAPILAPGQGIHPRVKRTIEQESPILLGEPPIRIRWKSIAADDFVEVDREQRTLWLNSKYRHVVLHGERGGVNDAPLTKTLLYLVYEDLFRGQFMGVKDKENQFFWNEVLTAAVQAETEAREQND